MKSDLSTLSPTNILSKYADDISLLVPQYCDVDLATEFDNIQHWAMHNKMIINLSKTKEIVFRRPCPLRYNFVPSVDDVALVDYVNPFVGRGKYTSHIQQCTSQAMGSTFPGFTYSL